MICKGYHLFSTCASFVKGKCERGWTTLDQPQLRVPGIRRQSSSFHLNLPPAARVFPEQFGILSGRHLHLPEVISRPVAQLPGELSELVAAVAVSSGLGSGQDSGSAQVLRSERIARDLLPAEPQQRHRRVRHAHEPGLRQRLRLHSGETRSFHLARPGLLGRVHGESLEGDVVEVEPLQRGTTGRETHVGHPDRTEASEGGHTGDEDAIVLLHLQDMRGGSDPLKSSLVQSVDW
ncbi:hypothetical protein EYF80_021794 [Liparis tanakae]|uniref:Uncharacterized protein n=1 Tax=Liparis tanakae TaxID=230148 RepID=A0A4Z2HT34_9TELE|nr:hypothetical protein EYF80_021794 [Liparis tanakae]